MKVSLDLSGAAVSTSAPKAKINAKLITSKGERVLVFRSGMKPVIATVMSNLKTIKQKVGALVKAEHDEHSADVAMGQAKDPARKKLLKDKKKTSGTTAKNLRAEMKKLYSDSHALLRKNNLSSVSLPIIQRDLEGNAKSIKSDLDRLDLKKLRFKNLHSIPGHRDPDYTPKFMADEKFEALEAAPTKLRSVKKPETVGRKRVKPSGRTADSKGKAISPATVIKRLGEAFGEKFTASQLKAYSIVESNDGGLIMVPPTGKKLKMSRAKLAKFNVTPADAESLKPTRRVR